MAVDPESTDAAVGDLTQFNVGIGLFRRGDLEEVARVGTELYDGQEGFPLPREPPQVSYYERNEAEKGENPPSDHPHPTSLPPWPTPSHLPYRASSPTRSPRAHSCR